MIVVKNKRCSVDKIRKEYPNVVIVDVTSHAKDDMIRLSPFYPHGGIPVPFSPGWTAMSVESIWQGLKVFQSAGVDTALFRNNTMKDLKRTVRKYGTPQGHRKGVGRSELLGYIEARKLIYVPTYKWMLEHKAMAQVAKLKELAKTKTVVLLDYDTNPDVENGSSPLSHASLIKAYLDGNYPVYEGYEQAEAPEQEAVHYDFTVGQKVKHPTFGEGTIKTLNGDKATVIFEIGEKLLSLRFAKLEVL